MKGGLAGCSSTRSLPSKGPRGRGRGPAQGAVAPASPAGWRGSLGRAGLRRGAGASGVSGFPPRGGSGPGSGPGPGLAGAPRARSASGRFEAAAPASWARRGAANLGAASAPSTRASPPGVRASPVLVGKLRQRWRALGRPGSIRAVPRGPLRGITKRSSTWRRLRGCEARAAAIVNPNPRPLRRRSASRSHRPRGSVPTTEVT